jgi:hypothetical protein
MGLQLEALELAACATLAKSMPDNEAIHCLSKHMKETVPSIGVGFVFNSSHKQTKRVLMMQDLLQKPTIYPNMVIPLGRDGSASHAICVVDNLIFDFNTALGSKMC